MMTIHVAICDDSDVDAQYVRSLTASWAAARQLEPDRRIPVDRAVSDALWAAA